MSIKDKQLPSLVVRGGIGGIFMGLANLVPGISGGTMLLATGIYPRFIRAIAELTTLKFRLPSMAVLGSVAMSACLAILLLAGTVKELVVDHRWVMYSLFIGLTFGGIPIVWRMAKPATKATWSGFVAGFVGMAGLALLQASGAGAGSAGEANIVLLFFAGVAGASAMILPGISGGYLLLVLGQYVPILSAVDQLKDALKAGAWADVFSVGFSVVLPVGLGVLVGIVVVSNLLKWLLKRYEKATLGVLLGLLLGAVVGLFPFQEGVAPQMGDVVKGQIVTSELLDEMDAEDYPVRYFNPSTSQVMSSLGLIVLGLGTTLLISKFGGSEESAL